MVRDTHGLIRDIASTIKYRGRLKEGPKERKINYRQMSGKNQTTLQKQALKNQMKIQSHTHQRTVAAAEKTQAAQGPTRKKYVPKLLKWLSMCGAGFEPALKHA